MGTQFYLYVFFITGFNVKSISRAKDFPETEGKDMNNYKLNNSVYILEYNIT